MATNWDLYNKRLNINGSSQRERDLNTLQTNLSNNLPNSLSCKSVKINGLDRGLEFTKTAKDYIKTIHSLPNETFECGDYVLYKTCTYLITETDVDNEVNTVGKMQECNWTLKFQSPDGDILSYPCIDSKNSGGEKEGTVITLGDTQKLITLPYDQNTILLRNGDRFFIDRHPTEPKSYKIISVDTTSKNYGNKGLIELTLEETPIQLTGERPDRVDLGVCNYFEATTPPPSNNGYASLACSNPSNEITLGGSARTFTFNLQDENGLSISFVPVWTFNWSGASSSSFSVSYPNSTQCKIAVVDENNYDLLGLTFTVICATDDGLYSASLDMTITM